MENVNENQKILLNKENYITTIHHTAVSDVNKVEVSTLLNRNIDVNYQ